MEGHQSTVRLARWKIRCVRKGQTDVQIQGVRAAVHLKEAYSQQDHVSLLSSLVS